MVKNLVGPPVFGADFVGRNYEIRSAWDSLNSNNSLLLASPRRVGKSSFSRKLIEKAQTEGYNTIYLDIQGIETECEFAEMLKKESKRILERGSSVSKVFNIVTDTINKVKKVKVAGVDVEFADYVEKLYSELDRMLSFKGRTLIVIDELAVFLQALFHNSDRGKERVVLFLNRLRNIRLSKSKEIVWVFCSSISITGFASQHGLSNTINDLYSFELGEMNDAEAMQLLSELCAGVGISSFTQSEMEIILGRIGWKLPFFLQLFFKKYMEHKVAGSNIALEELMDVIFNQITHEHQLATWSERLSGYGRYEIPALKLLNYLCTPEHRSDRVHLETVISPYCDGIGDSSDVYSAVKQMLENDGYIIANIEGNILFRSPIIREYWFNKFVR